MSSSSLTRFCSPSPRGGLPVVPVLCANGPGPGCGPSVCGRRGWRAPSCSGPAVASRSASRTTGGRPLLRTLLDVLSPSRRLSTPRSLRMYSGTGRCRWRETATPRALGRSAWGSPELPVCSSVWDRVQEETQMPAGTDGRKPPRKPALPATGPQWEPPSKTETWWQGPLPPARHRERWPRPRAPRRRRVGSTWEPAPSPGSGQRRPSEESGLSPPPVVARIPPAAQ